MNRYKAGAFRVLAFLAVAVAVALGCALPAHAAEKPEGSMWTFDKAKSDELAEIGEIQGEGAEATYQGIEIDATAGKFSPRISGDTQVNAGTTLSIPVEANESGATLTVTLSGGSTSFTAQVGDAEAVAYQEKSGSVAVEIPALAEPSKVVIAFTAQSYLSSISLEYADAEEPEQPEEEYPGVPADVQPLDRNWSLVGVGTESAFEGFRGEYDGLLIDASSGKFAPRDGDVQVNAGTVIYVPVAADPAGAVLTVSCSPNGQTITVNGVLLPRDGRVELECAEATYVAVKVAGSGSAYFTGISVDYASDTSTYPGTPEGGEAVDTTWNLAADEDASNPRPTVNSGVRVDWAGIRIDALAGGAKFGPRDSDTQVNSGTTLYLPLAADELGATLRIEGNNNGNLVLTVDGEPQGFGRDIALDASDAPRYVRVDFELPEGATDTASSYLTSIAIDYASDNSESYHVVTVGEGGQYQTIGEALANETSSLKDRLVLSIAPGDYPERVVVSQPGVVFQNADDSGEQQVLIHAAYYSSNTFDENGVFVPQDDYDLGTDQSATVLVESTATGFTARGITFQNDYNVTDHTGEGEQTPAVAFNAKADKVDLENCSFIGRQDTLYVQGAGNRVYLNGCYIEGTVDFVFGDADAFFSGCTLHMAAYSGRTSGYYTAPNTKSGYTGLVFSDCTLTADPSVTDVSLGRPWQNLAYYTGTHYDDEGHTIYDGFDPDQPHPDYANVSSAASFVGCTMPATLSPEHWSYWTGRVEDNGKTTSITYEPTVRFSEVGCTYPGGEPDLDKVVLATIDGQTNPDDAADDLLDDMGIGSSWNPAGSGPVDDSDAWGGAEDPEVPGGDVTDPEQPGGNEPGEEEPDSGSEGGESDKPSKPGSTDSDESADGSEVGGDGAESRPSADSDQGDGATGGSEGLPATGDVAVFVGALGVAGATVAAAGVALRRKR